jgi:hypothetical protein
MTGPDLPPDLAALERELAALGQPGPPALRPRVLAAVGRELRRDGRRPAWRFAAATAAAVLLWVNLSMSVANNTDWRLAPATEPGQIAATADRLRELAPDLPDAELRRQALLARAGAALAPAVNLSPSWEQIRTTKERDRWDER